MYNVLTFCFKNCELYLHSSVKVNENRYCISKNCYIKSQNDKRIKINDRYWNILIHEAILHSKKNLVSQILYIFG